MTDRDTLLRLSDMAWQVLQESIDGLTQEQCWASVDLLPGEYMHTDGN